VLALGLAIAALAYIIITYHKQIWDEVQYIWNSIKALWTDFTDWATGLFKSWGAGITKWWDDLWDGIYSTIENVWNKIQAIINAALAAISRVTGAVSGIA